MAMSANLYTERCQFLSQLENSAGLFLGSNGKRESVDTVSGPGLKCFFVKLKLKFTVWKSLQQVCKKRNNSKSVQNMLISVINVRKYKKGYSESDAK